MVSGQFISYYASVDCCFILYRSCYYLLKPVAHPLKKGGHFVLKIQFHNFCASISLEWCFQLMRRNFLLLNFPYLESGRHRRSQRSKRTGNKINQKTSLCNGLILWCLFHLKFIVFFSIDCSNVLLLITSFIWSFSSFVLSILLSINSTAVFILSFSFWFWYKSNLSSSGEKDRSLNEDRRKSSGGKSKYQFVHYSIRIIVLDKVLCCLVTL